MEDTTPKFLESVTEHPDVQRLIKQVIRGDKKIKELQAKNERLKEAIELLLCHVAGCWCKTYGMEKGKCSRCQAELALKGE